jgi:hypothetical protein
VKKKRYGLTFPPHIDGVISDELRAILSEDGHGIAFISTLYAQAQLYRGGKVIFRKTLVINHLGVNGTLEELITMVKLERHLYTLKGGAPNYSGKGKGGFGKYHHVDKRRPHLAYWEFYISLYDKETKVKTKKQLQHGASPPTTGQELHALCTLRYYKELLLENPLFDKSIFKQWKKYRLYDKNHTPDTPVVINYNEL